MILRTLKLSTIVLVVATMVMGDGVGRTEVSKTFSLDKDEAAGTAQLIDDFDETVQKRFHDVLGFGMARITPPDRSFIPETEEEKAAVKAFKKANLTVALLLVGRLVLAPKPELQQFEDYNLFFKRAINTVRFVKVNTKPRRLPSRYALWESGREAMTVFDRGKDSYEGTAGEWSIRARPVRAAQECLNCHHDDYEVVYTQPRGAMMQPSGHKIQVGDPIGAMFYLYLQ